jgi:hypothetical protein
MGRGERNLLRRHLVKYNKYDDGGDDDDDDRVMMG